MAIQNPKMVFQKKKKSFGRGSNGGIAQEIPFWPFASASKKFSAMSRGKRQVPTFRRAEYEEWQHYEKVLDELVATFPEGTLYAYQWPVLAFKLELAIRDRAHTRLRISWVEKFFYGPASKRAERLDELTFELMRTENRISSAVREVDQLAEAEYAAAERWEARQREFDDRIYALLAPENLMPESRL